MSRRVIWIALAIAVAGSVAADAKPLTTLRLQQELRGVRRLGAQAYVNSLYEKPDRWGAVLNQIELGDRNWLLLARKMMAGADGAASEELRSSLATALVRRPSNVLRLLPYNSGALSWTVRNICDAPFPTPGKVWLRRYRARALRAVETVHDSELRNRQAECLLTLRRIDLSKPAGAYE